MKKPRKATPGQVLAGAWLGLALLIAVLAPEPTGAQTPGPQSLEGAYALLDAGDAEAALEAFDALAQGVPTAPEVRFGRAAALLEVGRSAEAEQLFGELERLDPNDLSTQAYLVRCELTLGRADAAGRRLEALRRLAPYSDLLHLQTLEWIFPLDAPQVALEQARFLLELTLPEAARARTLYLAGLLELRVGDRQAALPLLEQAARPSPRQSAHWAAWLSAQGAGDILAVDAAALAEALERFPESPEILALAALREIRMERLDEARRLEARLRPIDAAQADLVLGRLELESLRFDRAAEVFQRIVDRDPGDARARRDLGVALARMGRAEAGLASLQKALELDPTDGIARFEAARLLTDLGRLEEAAVALGPLVEAEHADRRAIHLMYQVQRRLGDKAAAERWRQALLEAEPASPAPAAATSSP